ncbi:MAG: glutathione S-transferase family protein [Pseudomonadales bacterium]
MHTLYGDKLSGNCYKIQLLLSHLQTEYQWVDVNILAGESRTDAFLKMSNAGRIPLLALDSGEYLPESNAILNYFAQGSSFLPEDALQRAKVLSWQFFEQYSHEPYIAVARFIAKYQGMPESRREEFNAKQAGGNDALAVMEQHLATQDYFVGNCITIADFSLYAYTHVAEDGGFSLERYPAIQRWLARIEAHPKHIKMEA